MLHAHSKWVEINSNSVAEYCLHKARCPGILGSIPSSCWPLSFHLKINNLKIDLFIDLCFLDIQKLCCCKALCYAQLLALGNLLSKREVKPNIKLKAVLGPKNLNKKGIRAGPKLYCVCINIEATFFNIAKCKTDAIVFSLGSFYWWCKGWSLSGCPVVWLS